MAMGASGGILWQEQLGQASPTTPLYATADGGVIATTSWAQTDCPPGNTAYNPFAIVQGNPPAYQFGCQANGYLDQVYLNPDDPNYGQLGTIYTLDQNGNQDVDANNNPIPPAPDTGAQIAWMGERYAAVGSGVASESLPSTSLASSWTAVQGGSPSNRAAIQPSPFPKMKSCIQQNGSSTCPYDYLLVALESLQEKLSANCPDCAKYVFGKLQSVADQAQFSKFINRYPPLFFDGTKSTFLITQTCEPPSSGSFDASFGCTANSLFKYGAGFTVGDYFAQNPGTVALAVRQGANARNPNGKRGLLVFFNPALIFTTVPNPAIGVQTAGLFPNFNGPSDGQIWNESLLFHESLHEFYDFDDATIQTKFGLPPNPTCTANISDYLAYALFTKIFNDCGGQ